MPRTDHAQHNWTLGELSPRAFGRFDPDRPIFRNGAGIIENLLIEQLGGVFFRPGTIFVAETKDSTVKSRLIRFEFSTTQLYVLELGNLYIRFFANAGQVISGGLPVEVTTPYLTSQLFAIKTAQKFDVMYLVHPSHPPQKLIRLTATSFSIAAVPFVRGPFLDDNITATTITPSADTGAGITLTASAAIFEVAHVGSFWKVKNGVVKITAFTDSTHVTGTVQAEPSGAAGNLGTGPGATTTWAEGAFSRVRGYPAAVSFHEGRLYYGGTSDKPQTFWGSVVGAYDNFAVGAADADAVDFEIASDKSSAIRWLISNAESLKIGTQAGTYSASSGSSTAPITASNIQVTFNSDYGVANLAPQRISGYLFYAQSNLAQIREIIFDLIINRDRSSDMNLLADHVLRDGDGIIDLERQQSPNDRLWCVRSDGQLAVLTRNTEEKVFGWARMIAGSDAAGAGKFESVCSILPDGEDDQIWVIVKRVINGVTKRYVEYFSSERFTYDWEPLRLDCALTLNSPITMSAVTKASPAVVTATGHALVNGDQIKIDNVVGMTQLNGNHYKVAGATANTFQLTDLDDANVNSTAYSTYLSDGQVRKMVTALSGLAHLNGETVTIVADGAIPGGSQTKVVASGSITLDNPAAVVHVGLPYTSKLTILPLSDGGAGTGKSKMRRAYQMTVSVYRSLGFEVGQDESHLFQVIITTPNDPLGHPPRLFTGDLEPSLDCWWDKNVQLLLRQNQPLPWHVLSIAIRSEVEEKM